jgi:hypothetical protein
MKKIVVFSILFAIVQLSFGQCNFVVNTTDDFTGDVIKSLEEEVIARYTVRRILRYDLKAGLSKINEIKTIHFRFPGDLGCVSDRAFVMLKFENGDVIKVNYIGAVDCGENVLFTGIIDDELFDVLANHKLSQIRLSYTKHTLDVDVSKNDFFLNKIHCLD